MLVIRRAFQVEACQKLLEKYPCEHLSPEEGEYEDDHGDELEEEVQALLEVNGVHGLQANSERHLDYPEDDGHLHLHGVEEQKLK